jgi:hypothetical protein
MLILQLVVSFNPTMIMHHTPQLTPTFFNHSLREESCLRNSHSERNFGLPTVNEENKPTGTELASLESLSPFVVEFFCYLKIFIVPLGLCVPKLQYILAIRSSIKCVRSENFFSGTAHWVWCEDTLENFDNYFGSLVLCPRKISWPDFYNRKLVKKTGCKDVILILASPASPHCGMISS